MEREVEGERGDLVKRLETLNSIKLESCSALSP